MKTTGYLRSHPIAIMKHSEAVMSMSRAKASWVIAGLALLALVSGLAFALAGRGETPAAPPLAAEKLRDATERRTVNRTDQLIWDYQERIRQNSADVNAY